MIPGWKEEIQLEYLEFLQEHRKVSPAELAVRLSQPESNVVYWLTDLAREGKVRILAVELAEDAAPGSRRRVQDKTGLPGGAALAA